MSSEVEAFGYPATMAAPLPRKFRRVSSRSITTIREHSLINCAIRQRQHYPYIRRSYNTQARLPGFSGLDHFYRVKHVLGA
jgi:hypothetical protein